MMVLTQDNLRIIIFILNNLREQWERSDILKIKRNIVLFLLFITGISKKGNGYFHFDLPGHIVFCKWNSGFRMSESMHS